jgi:site-specific recombinase XerD
MNIFKTYKTLDEILPDFLAERKIVLKKRTLVGYVGRFKLFSWWLKEHKLSDLSLRRLSNQNISDFFVYLANERNLDRPTCQKYFITVRSLFQYALKRKEVDKEFPLDLVVFPSKKGDYSPELIPKEKFDALVNDMKENDAQLYLAAMIQYYAFIRPGIELKSLKTDDFDFTQGVIHVSETVAKTKVTRFATMTKDLYDICIWYGIDQALKNKFVFGKKRKFADKPVGINNFTIRFNRFRTKHGISDKVKFYSFKHTGITDMLNSGIPLIAVKDQAGHTRLSSTQHYAKKYAGIVNMELRNYSRTVNIQLTEGIVQ